MNVMEYKGYTAKINYSNEDQCFFGEVIGIVGALIFEGQSVKELEEQFHNCIDDYLAICEEKGMEPQKEFKGSFNIRISPETHKELYVQAQKQDISLNKLIDTILSGYLNVGNRLNYNHEDSLMVIGEDKGKYTC